MSVEPTSVGPDFLVLFRAAGAAEFGPRERALVRLCHEEAGRLVGGPLASADEPRAADLSPRLREALGCLLDGLGEKGAARRLGVRPATLHGYVLAVYRHYGATSRAELMARFVGRGRPPA